MLVSHQGATCYKLSLHVGGTGTEVCEKQSEYQAIINERSTFIIIFYWRLKNMQCVLILFTPSARVFPDPHALSFPPNFGSIIPH